MATVLCKINGLNAICVRVSSCDESMACHPLPSIAIDYSTTSTVLSLPNGWPTDTNRLRAPQTLIEQTLCLLF